MTFAELKEKHGFRLTQLSERFGIPYKSVQNWNTDRVNCPEYVIRMMDELLTIDEQK